MLNLYQLQMFLAVVDSGSFSAAAGQLHLTQPAVSEGVRALEARLGARLFERRGHKAALTPEGAALVDPARQLLAQAAQAEQHMFHQRGVIGGTLRLATATSAGAPLLATRLGEFSRAHSGVRSALVVRERDDLLEGLRTGEFDVGFLAEHPRSTRLAVSLVALDEWVILAPPDHAWQTAPAVEEAPAPAEDGPPRRKRGRPANRRPLAGPHRLAGLPIAALREQPLVLENTDSILGALARRDLRDLLQERGLPWSAMRPVCEVVSAVQVLRLVEAGVGVGVVQLSQLEAYGGPALAFRIEKEPLIRRLFAVRDQRVTPSPLTAAWWDFLAARSPAGDSD